MKENQEPVIPIPLPTEIPTPPRLDQLPLDILHSATVEMLIQQVEDLTARLKVHIRRNSQVEQQLLLAKEQQSQLESNLANLSSQNEILNEKYNVWNQKKEEQSRFLEQSHSEISLLQSQNKELFQASKKNLAEKEQRLQDHHRQLENLKAKVQRLHKIRTKAKNKLRHFLIRAGKSHAQLQEKLKQSQRANEFIKKQFNELSQEVSENQKNFQTKLQDLKREMGRQLNGKNDEMAQLQKLLDQKSQALAEAHGQLKDIKGELFQEKQHRVSLKQASKELADLKNKQIHGQRNFEKKLEDSELARQSERSRSKALQKEVDNQKQEIEALKIDNKACENKILSLSKDNDSLSDQLESLQKLWIQSQDKLEKEIQRRQCLEKINKELSDSKNTKKRDQAIEAAQTTTPEKTDSVDIGKRLNEVFASQYIPIHRNKDLGL